MSRKRIDAHMHTYRLVRGYGRRGSVRSIKNGLVLHGDGSEERVLPPSFAETSCPENVLLEYMKLCNVAHGILMQSCFHGEQNVELKEIEKKYPDKFTATATIDPFTTNADLQIKNILSLGYKIIKLECSEDYGLAGIHRNFDYLSDGFRCLWEIANETEMSIAIDPGKWNTRAHKIPQLLNIASKYPRIKLIITHLGFPRQNNYTQWTQMLNDAKLDNVWFDISSMAGIEGEAYPFLFGQQCIQTAKEIVGAERLIFGTDFPGILNICSYKQSIDFIENCGGFNPSELDLVFYDNAVAAYGLDVSKL